MKDLQQNLAEENLSIFKIPLILHYNKRDLSKEGIPILPLEVLEKDLNGKLQVPSFPASALRGSGVGSSMKQCLLLTLRHLQKELKWTR